MTSPRFHCSYCDWGGCESCVHYNTDDDYCVQCVHSDNITCNYAERDDDEEAGPQ